MTLKIAFTEDHVVKSTSNLDLPYATLSEYLCHRIATADPQKLAVVSIDRYC